MSTLVAESLDFPNGQRAAFVRVDPATSASHIASALALGTPKAVVLLNGGTAPLDPEQEAQLRRLLHEGLARLAAESQITLITGGTEAGIFAVLGEGIAKWTPGVRCIGVVPSGPIRWPGSQTGDAALEPHHSHFVVVRGERWGDETATMYALAAAFGRPSIAVFAGGGKITLAEMQANLAANREMILLAGSGRNTDAVLAAKQGGSTNDPLVRKIAMEGNITPFPMSGGVDDFRRLVEAHLAQAGR